MANCQVRMICSVFSYRKLPLGQWCSVPRVGVGGVVLIMISEVMIHYTDVRAGLTNHYVISQLPHFLTFRPQISKLLQIRQLVGKQALSRHYTVITNNKET